MRRREKQQEENQQLDLINEICEKYGPKLDDLDMYWADRQLPKKVCEELSQ